jgi:hypothetical protein
MAEYARVNRANTVIEVYPILRSNLNRSIAAATNAKVSVGANVTDEELLQYLHVVVRTEAKPATPSGGRVNKLPPAKEPNGQWWVRYEIIPLSAADLVRAKDLAKDAVDANIALFNRREAARSDAGADIKARISAATTYDEVRTIGKELDDV